MSWPLAKASFGAPQSSTTAAGSTTSVMVLEGGALTVKGNATAVGTVQQINSAGSVIRTWVIGVNSITAIGPYSGTQQFLITCTAGSIDASVGDAVLGIPSLDFDIRTFGAKVDGVAVYDATTTNSTTCTIGSATANFTVADIGKACVILPYSDIGVQTKWGTITAVSSSGTCTAQVSAAPGVLTGAAFIYGTDDTAAVKLALSAAKTKRGTVRIPSGITLVTEALIIPTGTALRGTANFSTGGRAKDFTFAGASLVLAKYTAGAFILGGDAENVNSPKGIVISDLNADCLNLASNCYRNSSGRTESIRNCTFVRGTQEVLISSPTSRINNCIFMGHNLYNVVQLSGDSTFVDNIVTGAGNGYYGVKCSNGDDINIANNHIWKDGFLNTLLGGQIFLSFNSANTLSGGVSVTNNKFDTAYGPQILIKVSGNSVARGVSIVGNIAMQNDNVPNATYPYIQLDVGSGSSLRGLAVTGNIGRGSWNDASKGQYTNFIDNSATAGNLYGVTVVANAIDNCAALYASLTPTYSAGNVTIAGSGTSVAVG